MDDRFTELEVTLKHLLGAISLARVGREDLVHKVLLDFYCSELPKEIRTAFQIAPSYPAKPHR